MKIKPFIFLAALMAVYPSALIANDATSSSPPAVTMSSSDSGGVPAGAVMAFNLPGCPTGWVHSNGLNGTVDLRGEFIRGWDAGRGADPGRGRNTFQNHAMQRMTGAISFYRGIPRGASGVFRQSGSGAATFSGPGPGVGATTGLAYDNSWGGNTAAENRPRNRAMLICQKQ